MMNYLTIEQQKIPITKEGFLVDGHCWTPKVAEALAKHIGIELTQQHWQVIHFLRQFYQKFDTIPPLRIFIKKLKAEVGTELANSITLHQLFPESPLKYACLIAGLPKPKHCM